MSVWKGLRLVPFRPLIRIRSLTVSPYTFKQNDELSSSLNNDDMLQSQLLDNQPSQPKSSLDESLFGILNDLDKKSLSESTLYKDLGLSTKINPRDVAKKIRVTGVLAGRTVDMIPGVVSYGIHSIRVLSKANKIRYLQSIQRRYIRPAKYRKQKKREWWRRRFQEGFKDLLAKVIDARRRGY